MKEVPIWEKSNLTLKLQLTPGWESISCVHCQTMNAVNLFYGSVQNGSSNAAGWTNISIKPTPSKIRRAK